MKKYTSTILTLAVVLLFVWYAWLNPELFEPLTQVGLGFLFLIIFFRVITIWSNGLFTKWTVEAFTNKLSMREGFMVAVLTAVGNFFGPLLGGMGVRAVYLKKYHQLPYSKFTATLIGYYQMMFIFNSLMAIIGLLLLARTGQSTALLLFFAAWMFGFASFAFIRLPARRRFKAIEQTRIGKVLVKIIYDIEDGWQLLLQNRRLLIRMAGLAIINLIALYFVSLLEFMALGLHINFAALALYTALVQASLLLSITPGAVGLREAMLVILAGTIGLSTQEIVQVAVLDRGIYFVMLAILMLATRHSKMREKFAKSQPKTA